MFPFVKRNSTRPEVIIDVEEPIKKENADIEQTSVVVPSIVEEAVQDDDMAKDLAMLVGDAITIWAKKYGLENLPRDIVLDQAISILLTVRELMK